MTDAQAAADLNTVYRTITVETVTGAAIFNATDDSEFDALTEANKDRWIQLCQVADVDVSSGIALNLEASLFGPATATRANLQALKNPPASRAEELGVGLVLEAHVAFARSL
jgi:hypothetical protein